MAAAGSALVLSLHVQGHHRQRQPALLLTQGLGVGVGLRGEGEQVDGVDAGFVFSRRGEDVGLGLSQVFRA